MSPELQQFLRSCSSTAYVVFIGSVLGLVFQKDDFDRRLWLIPLAFLLASFALGVAGNW